MPTIQSSVDIELPTDFDTLFSWVRSSDYTCGTEKYIRIQNSSHGIDKEEHFFHDNKHLPIRQLTIRHFVDTSCNTVDDVADFEIADILVDQRHQYLAENNKIKIIVSDSMLLKSGHWFSIFGVEECLEGLIERKLMLRTVIDRQLVYLDFRSNLPDDPNFIKDMQRAASSIAIN